MRVYKLIRAEAREKMSSQDRPEATAAASAPAREPEPQPNERRDTSTATNNPSAAHAGNAPRETGRRHGRRRHRNAGGGGNSGGGGGEQREAQPRTGQPERELNLDELRELSELLNAQGFNEFEIEREGFRLRLSKQTFMPMPATPSGQPFVPPTITPVAPPQSEQAAVAPSAQTSTGTPPNEPQPAATESAAEELHTITSPIVGTFYRSSSPTAEPFVRQGSQVEPDTVVCIIEAMKLMNEIQAEVSGTVEKIYVENGQPVEYGQSLFGIKK